MSGMRGKPITRVPETVPSGFRAESDWNLIPRTRFSHIARAATTSTLSHRPRPDDRYQWLKVVKNSQ
jgi:hypothetical protein